MAKADAVVCTYNDVDLAYRICHFLRTEHGIDNLVAQVAEPKELARFKELGVTTMNPAMDRAALMVLLVRNPAAFALLSRTDDDKEVWEVVLRNKAHVGVALRDLHFPGDVLVVAMRRNGELLVPHGATRLELGDRLTLVGSLDTIKTARGMLL